MLVLSRKAHQQIQIGDRITISILRIEGNVIRVGIDAPPEVRVLRGELPRSDDSQRNLAAVSSDAMAALVVSETGSAKDRRPSAVETLRSRLLRRMAATVYSEDRSRSRRNSSREA